MRKRHVDDNPFGGRVAVAEDPEPEPEPKEPPPTIPPGGDDDGD